MGAPRGDSAVTRQVILRAARELFAARGVDGVSVRDIAAAAGVNHALVHRYFGAKNDIVGAILLAEGERMSAMGRPEADVETSLAAMREVMLHALTDGRTSLLLMLRAELDGLEPERMLGGAPLRPLVVLRAWLEEKSVAGSSVDAEAVAMVLAAAIMGLASCRPMLATGVGADGQDDDLLSRCVDVIVATAGAFIADNPGSAPGSPGSEGGDS